MIKINESWALAPWEDNWSHGATEIDRERLRGYIAYLDIYSGNHWDVFERHQYERANGWKRNASLEYQYAREEYVVKNYTRLAVDGIIESVVWDSMALTGSDQGWLDDLFTRSNFADEVKAIMNNRLIYGAGAAQCRLADDGLLFEGIDPGLIHPVYNVWDRRVLDEIRIVYEVSAGDEEYLLIIRHYDDRIEYELRMLDGNTIGDIVPFSAVPSVEELIGVGDAGYIEDTGGAGMLVAWMPRGAAISGDFYGTALIDDAFAVQRAINARETERNKALKIQANPILSLTLEDLEPERDEMGNPVEGKYTFNLKAGKISVRKPNRAGEYDNMSLPQWLSYEPKLAHSENATRQYLQDYSALTGISPATLMAEDMQIPSGVALDKIYRETLETARREMSEIINIVLRVIQSGYAYDTESQIDDLELNVEIGIDVDDAMSEGNLDGAEGGDDTIDGADEPEATE